MIREWFGEFLRRHTARHPRSDWPTTAENPVFYDAWYELFDRGEITRDEAEDASRRLLADPPRWLGEHPGALVALAKAHRRPAPPELPGRPRPDPRRARWDALAEPDREAIRAEARRRHPELARLGRRWPSLLTPACLDLMETALPPADRTTGTPGAFLGTPAIPPDNQDDPKSLRIHPNPMKG